MAKWEKNNQIYGRFVVSRGLAVFIIAGGSHMAPYESQDQTLEILKLMIATPPPTIFPIFILLAASLLITAYVLYQNRNSKREWNPINSDEIHL